MLQSQITLCLLILLLSLNTSLVAITAVENTTIITSYNSCTIRYQLMFVVFVAEIHKIGIEIMKTNAIFHCYFHKSTRLSAVFLENYHGQLCWKYPCGSFKCINTAWDKNYLKAAGILQLSCQCYNCLESDGSSTYTICTGYSKQTSSSSLWLAKDLSW